MHRKTKRQITESKHVQAQQIHRHRTAGTFFFSLLADAEHGSSHLAGKKFFSSAMCTIPLRTAKDLHCDENTHIGRIALWHAGAPSLPWCAHSKQSYPSGSPGSVDDLGAGLDGHLLLAAGDTMRHQTNILWKLPFPNALHLDSLFAVHNIVMDDAW